MMYSKYNGMKRARDWVGKRVSLSRAIGNGYCQAPAGYTGMITNLSSAGLTFEGDPCPCCTVRPRFTRLGYFSVRLAPEVGADLKTANHQSECGA